MRELNYQYKVIEENNINGHIILKVEDSVYNKIVFMELYKEISSSDWDLGYKLEDEMKVLKKSKEITDFFINDDYSSDKKSYYKIYDDENQINKPKNNEIKESNPEIDLVNDNKKELPNTPPLSSMEKANDSLKKAMDSFKEINTSSNEPNKELEFIDEFPHLNYLKQKDAKREKIFISIVMITSIVITLSVIIFTLIKNSNDNEVIKSSYENGIEFFKKKKYSLSVGYLRNSCDYNKNKDACFIVASMYYEYKITTSNNNERALNYYKTGCSLGDSRSCKRIESWFGKKGKLQK